MSIYVYITRHRNPLEDGDPIEQSEWCALINADSSFRVPDQSSVEWPRKPPSHYSVWTGHPETLEAWFTWTDGQIDVSNPDEPMIAKAMTLANALNATVVSEMGEIYNDDGSHKGFVDGEPW